MLLSFFFLVPCVLASKVYVLFGPSQAGKSSFINKLAGKAVAEVGSGMGISQTTTCQEYKVERPDGTFIFMDVPGISDNYLNALDDEIMLAIREKIRGYMTAVLLETGTERKSIDGIIIFEPLDYDYFQVYQTLSKAEILFGANMYDSSLLVFTKGDIDYARYPEAIELLPFCEWQSLGIDDAKMTSNWEAMKAQLTAINSYLVEEMDQVLLDVSRLAEIACDSQIIEKIIVQVTETRKIQDGFKEFTIKKDLPPVQRIRKVSQKVKKHELVFPAWTFTQRQQGFADFFNLVVKEIHKKQRCVLNSPGLSSTHCMVVEPSRVCAEIFAVDCSAKTDAQLLAEFNARWPYKEQTQFNRVFQEIWQKAFIGARKFVGCGVPIYKMVTVDETIDVPYQHVETVEEVVKEPIYKTVTEIVEKEQDAPKRPLHEFLDDARKLVAQQIRTGLEANIN